ncbi:hypothetical protein SmJEL517_g02626 [Synchytrium microbalum]|uniref:Uncharacterized protein n=1 Tax=Synchytrium microbalum TaxID=1806994 RepID=A0A507CBL3_9FUNG|nr:uncharacterized protein SmJEL517_g02626 [Synchytrium microbalum]TPX34933.1 hypothetical protein SmJEL517_g02626 [Synchytrium microbalum]
MTLENFKVKYIERCHAQEIDPVQSILAALDTCTDHILDLTSQTLSTKVCASLAFALADDKEFTKLIFRDAYVGDEGCALIANALKTNLTCAHLDLRGNNIRSDGATALAQLLRVNSCITVLLLEWNSIGVWEKGVLDLADALGHNGSLIELDLRNNKISSIAGQHLAISLKHNTSLEKLDLRWNHLGLIGGRAFEDLFKWNHVITSLDLAGNEVPEDQLGAMTIALERNLQQRQHAVQEHSHALHLSSTIDAIAKAHEVALHQLTDKLNNVETKSRTLSEELDRKVSQHQSTETTVSKLQEEIALLHSNRKAMEETQFRERKEYKAHAEGLERHISGLQSELAGVKQDRIRMHSDLTGKILSLEALVKSLEVSQENGRREKMALLEGVAAAEEREQRAHAKMDEKIRKLEESQTRKIRQLEQVIGEEQAKSQQLRAAQEAERSQYEQDLEVSRSKLVDQKRTFEEHFSNTESRIRATEASRRDALERDIEALRNQVTALQDASTNIKHKLSERDAELSTSQHSLKLVASDLSITKSSLARSETEVEDLRAKLSGAESKMSDLQGVAKAAVEKARHDEEVARHAEARYHDIKIVLDKKEALLKEIEQDEKTRWETLTRVFKPHHYTTAA